MMVNIKILESALLFILLLNVLRTYLVTNRLLLVVVACFLILFILSQKVIHRLILVFAIALIVFGFILISRVNQRINNPANTKIHDGVIITEQAYLGLIQGKNPYSISFEEAYKKRIIYQLIKTNHEETHYTYSPLMFLINIPFFYLTDLTLHFVDMRVSIIIFLFITSLIGLLIVQEKVLFLIIFLFNPIFLSSVFFGANDTFILFFFFFVIFFLYKNRVSLATISLGLAFGTKLLILPLVPLYFLYIFLKSKSKLSILLKQLSIFLIVTLFIYLPFAIWNFGDLIDDILIYHLQGGVLNRPVAGYLGLPQLLLSLNIISPQTSLIFYPFAALASAVFLLIAYRLFKKSLSLTRLSFLFVAHFILVFSFSRILQTDYLAFISQVLLLSGFAREDKPHEN